MKKTKIYINVLTAALMMLLLSLPGCVFDDFPEDNEPENGYLLLSLNSERGGTRSSLFSGDAEVNKARVIVFDNNDDVEHNQLYTANTDLDNPIRIQLTTGTKTVYVVANETSTVMTNALTGVTSAAGLEAVMADEITAGLSAPLVMMGKKTVSLLTPGLTQEAVTLIRAAAKINIKLKKETSDDVEISKISLLSNTGKTPLWEGGATVAAQTYWNHVVSTSQTLTASDWHALTLYVYENLGNSSTSKTNATQLELEGTFNGMPTTYRVYVNENVAAGVNPGDPISSVTNPNDHLYNIKRNFEYNLYGTIKGLGQFDGITIITSMEDWTDINKTAFVGYGYMVEVDGTSVVIRNGEEDCAPYHNVELKALQGLTFTESGTDTETFTDPAANAGAAFTLNAEPAGGDYLEVWYNGVHVHTFTK